MTLATVNTVRLPEYVSIGNHTYTGEIWFHRWGQEKVKIGKYCSIATQVKIMAGGNHRIDTVSTYPFDTMLMEGKSGGERSYEEGGGIEIGSDVWLGFGAQVMGKVKIGDGAVVAAGSVVMTDVPPYAVVVGNPARVMKFRFTEGAVTRLLEIKWWDWKDEEVRARVDDFYLPIADFVKKYYR